ncbi:hypothetical protein TIFTF001_035441 [Ficus carica]|uniref:Uncharacterized protein n=1 Tax=Ficus carica TaxID=3494 RepID=A0AA88J6G7_FICCA|nr:hypothetical protein TIFTF001_035441 [Ficus carica]
MLAANISEKGQGKAHTAFHVSSSQKTKVHTAESDALKTTSPRIGTGSQDAVIFDSDIGAATDMGVQAAMEFLTADKVIVSREDVKAKKNKETIKYNLPEIEGEAQAKSDQFVRIKEEIMPDPEKLTEVEKDGKEKNRGLDVMKLEEPDNE